MCATAAVPLNPTVDFAESTEGTDAVKEAGLRNGGTAFAPLLERLLQTHCSASTINWYLLWSTLLLRSRLCNEGPIPVTVVHVDVPHKKKNLNESPGQFSRNLRPLTTQHLECPLSKMKCKVCEHQSK